MDGRLLINTIKRTGPICEPCGTPQEIVLYSDWTMNTQNVYDIYVWLSFFFFFFGGGVKPQYSYSERRLSFLSHFFVTCPLPTWKQFHTQSNRCCLMQKTMSSRGIFFEEGAKMLKLFNTYAHTHTCTHTHLHYQLGTCTQTYDNESF